MSWQGPFQVEKFLLNCSFIHPSRAFIHLVGESVQCIFVLFGFYLKPHSELSGVIPGGAQVTVLGAGIKPTSAACTANSLCYAITLTPIQFVVDDI